MDDGQMDRLKLVYNDDIRVVNMRNAASKWYPETSQTEDCINEIRALATSYFFPSTGGDATGSRDFDLQYVNDENDVITMNSDLELREAFRISHSMGRSVLKVRVAAKSGALSVRSTVTSSS